MQKKDYQNGDWYFGELSNGHKSGLGLFVRPLKLAFIGEWAEGDIAGAGVLVTPQGKIFSDKSENLFLEKLHNRRFDYFLFKKLGSEKQKYGFLKKAKEIYQGNFSESTSLFSGKSPQGFLVIHSEDSIRKGTFAQSGQQDVGELETNFEHFIGQFSHGKKHGVGYLRNYQLKTNTIADFKNDAINSASIDFQKGNITIKHFTERKIEGFVHFSDGRIYIGELMERPSGPEEGPATLAHGFGALFQKNGDYYMGGWEAGKKSGFGLETLFEEERVRREERFERQNYCGFFSNDQREGLGRLEIENAKVFEGTFKEGKMSGIIRVSNNRETNDAKNKEFAYFQFQQNHQLREIPNKEALLIFKEPSKNGVFDRRDFQDFAYNRLCQIEEAIREEKKSLLERFIKASKQLKAKYELFERFAKDQSIFFERKRKLVQRIETIRRKIYGECQDFELQAILIDPIFFVKTNNINRQISPKSSGGRKKSVSKTQKLAPSHSEKALVTQLLKSLEQVDSRSLAEERREAQESFVSKFAETVLPKDFGQKGKNKTGTSNDNSYRKSPKIIEQKTQADNFQQEKRGKNKLASTSPVGSPSRTRLAKASPSPSRAERNRIENLPNYFKRLLEKNEGEKFINAHQSQGKLLFPIQTQTQKEEPPSKQKSEKINARAEQHNDPPLLKNPHLSAENNEKLSEAKKDSSEVSHRAKSLKITADVNKQPGSQNKAPQRSSFGRAQHPQNLHSKSNEFAEELLLQPDSQSPGLPANKTSISSRNSRPEKNSFVIGSDFKSANLLSQNQKSLDADKINFIKINNIKIDTSKISNEIQSPLENVKLESIGPPAQNNSTNSMASLNRLINNFGSETAEEGKSGQAFLKQKKIGASNAENIEKASGLRNNLMSIEELNEDAENQEPLHAVFKSKVRYDMEDYLDNIEANLMDQFLSIEKAE